MSGGGDLDAALLEELRLRSRLNALVHERAEALREAERVETRAGLPGADGSLAELAARWRSVAERVAGDIEEQRAATSPSDGSAPAIWPRTDRRSASRSASARSWTRALSRERSRSSSSSAASASGPVMRRADTRRGRARR